MQNLGKFVNMFFLQAGIMGSVDVTINHYF